MNDDSISRKRAIEVVQNRHFVLSKEKVIVINDLEKLPSTQPEIIRCKDCRKYKFGMCFCTMTSGVGKSPNGFCDWADARDGLE